MAWTAHTPLSTFWFRGSGGLKSCDSLLARIDCNDPTLKDLVVLPMKDFGSAELENLSLLLGKSLIGLVSPHALTKTQAYSTLLSRVREKYKLDHFGCIWSFGFNFLVRKTWKRHCVGKVKSM